MPCVAFVNKSARLSDEEADVIVEALRQHAAEDFGPLWPGLDLPLPIFVGKNDADLPADAYPMLFTDTTDVPGADAYHSVDPKGRYFGHVFVDAILNAGGGSVFGATDTPWAFPPAVSVAAGHEYDELVGDPTCDRYVVGPRTGPKLTDGNHYAVEVVDPVQGNSYIKKIARNGKTYEVACPDVVGPAWFGMGDGPLSFLKSPPAAWQAARGGYMDVLSDAGLDTFIFAEKDQVAADAVAEKQARGRLSRLGRRAINHVRRVTINARGEMRGA